MFDKDAIKEIAQAQSINAACAAIFDATESSADDIGNGVVALPSDFQTHDLEKYMPWRRRLRGHMVTSVAADFAAYVLTNKEDGAAVFINQTAMKAVAVLNMGGPMFPGHSDNRATLAAKGTAPYVAMLGVTGGTQLSQQRAAEFLEDWPGEVVCFAADGSAMSAPKAIAAVRKITIEAMSKVEATAEQLSASRSTFDQVKAASGPEPLPAFIHFDCIPFHGLQSRTFVMRLGIHTGGKEPTIGLRVINKELHDEQMANELAELVRDKLQDKMPVLVGEYAAGA